MPGAGHQALAHQPPSPLPFCLRLQDLAAKLREAEETQSGLQAECDQYRSILAETVRPGGEVQRLGGPTGSLALCPWVGTAPLWALFLWLNGEEGCSGRRSGASLRREGSGWLSYDTRSPALALGLALPGLLRPTCCRPIRDESPNGSVFCTLAGGAPLQGRPFPAAWPAGLGSEQGGRWGREGAGGCMWGLQAMLTAAPTGGHAQGTAEERGRGGTGVEGPGERRGGGAPGGTVPEAPRVRLPEPDCQGGMPSVPGGRPQGHLGHLGSQVLVTPHEVWSQKDSTAES